MLDGYLGDLTACIISCHFHHGEIIEGELYVLILFCLIQCRSKTLSIYEVYEDVMIPLIHEHLGVRMTLVFENTLVLHKS